MVIVKEINTKCKSCKAQDTRQLNPNESLSCTRCGYPLCVTGFQEVIM